MPVKSKFYAKRSTVVTCIVVAVVCGALDVGFAVRRGGAPLGLSIVTVLGAWMAVRYAKIVIVQEFDDRVEFRSPVIATRTSIPFSSVLEFYEPFKGAAVVVADVRGQPTRFEVPLARLSPSDGEQLLARLRERLHHAERSATERAPAQVGTATSAAPTSRGAV
jgi:hypothetical protein